MPKKPKPSDQDRDSKEEYNFQDELDIKLPPDKRKVFHAVFTQAGINIDWPRVIVNLSKLLYDVPAKLFTDTERLPKEAKFSHDPFYGIFSVWLYLLLPLVYIAAVIFDDDQTSLHLCLYNLVIFFMPPFMPRAI